MEQIALSARELSEHPDIRGLLALQRTCVHGSVAAAAAELGWSHPTLDHHIKNLEKLLDAKLLNRSPQGSRPTAVGRFVADRADEILALCHQVVVDVRTARHESSEILRCAMIPSLAMSLLPAVDHLLVGSTEGPAGPGSDGTRLDLTVEEISVNIADVQRGKLDFAIVVGDLQALSASGDRLSYELLCIERVYLCVAVDDPLVEHYPSALPPLALMSDAKWAVGTERHDPTDIGLSRISKAAGFTPKIGVKANDLSVVKRMVEAGLVVALLPESVLTADDRLHRWAVPKEMIRREILLVTRRASGSRALMPESELPASSARERLGAMFDVLAEAARAAFGSDEETA